MRRDFSAEVLGADGRPYVRPVVKYDAAGVPVHKDGQPEFSHYEKMTLRSFALEALSGRWKGEENMTIEDSSKRIKLYDKLCFSKDSVIDLDAAECTLIVECLNKQGRDPLVIYRMKAMLDTDLAVVATAQA